MTNVSYGKKVSKIFIDTKLNNKSFKIQNAAKKLSLLSNLKQQICFICGSKNNQKEISFYNTQYVKCKRCTHVFTNRRLSDSNLNKFYVNDITYSSTFANKKILKMRENLVRPKLAFIKKYVKGKKWLDVGSADGSAISVLSQDGFNCYGIEVSKNSREFAKKYRKLDLYPNTLETFYKENKKKFDTVSFFGVLEHLSDPIRALQISNKILKNDGIVAMTVPNYNSLSTYVQSLEKYTDRHLVPYSHIMLFTKKSIEYALKKTGFKSIAIWCWGMDVIELLKYFRIKNKNFKNSKLEKILIEKLNDIQFIFDKDLLGDEFLVVARKIK